MSGSAKNALEMAADPTWLRQANPQLASLLLAMESGVFVIDPRLPEAPIVYTNPALSRITGQTGPAFIGRPVDSLFTCDADQAARSAIVQAVAGDRPARVTVMCRRGDGLPLWCDINLSPVAGASGQTDYFIGVLTDMTDRVRAEQELDRRVRQQSAVAAVGRRALAGASLEDLINEAVSLARLTLDMEMASVFELLPRSNVLTLRAATGWPKERSGKVETKAVKGTIARACMDSRRPVIVTDFATDKRFRVPTFVRRMGVKACLVAPIVSRGAVFGVVSVQARAPTRFSQDDSLFLESLATVLGEAVDRMRAEDDLRSQQQRFDLAMRGANDGLWDWDLALDNIYFSARWKAMLGLGDDEIGAAPGDWLDRIHIEDRQLFEEALAAHVAGETTYFISEHRLRHHDEHYRWMLARGIAVRDAAGRATRVAGSLTDITERKRAETRLYKDAFHDALTGLPNRALFSDRLNQALMRVRRNKAQMFALLFLDFDRFKMVNDSLGHSFGDEMLIEIARRLQNCVRAVDTVARQGGDEFAILLADLENEERAEQVARRINDALAVPFILAGREIVSNASIGIAFSSLGYEHPEDMVRDADIAMYHAKNQGRARHVVFEKGMHVKAVTQLELETDLRRAIDRHEFALAFQPVVSLRTGHISSFEALVRWKHPERGFISPADFVPIAEETGLIVQIGREVLFAACRQIRDWRKMFPERDLSMNVNVSPKQFNEANLLSDVSDILRETGIEGRCLNLEITEGVMMEHPLEVTDRLYQLKALGARLHVDDFGTGYSSLGHLHRFPIDALKVDQSFVMTMSESDENLEIVRTIMALANNLKLKTVAEGVETVEHLAALRNLDCSFGQGYLFSRPLFADAATELLESDPVW